MDLSMSKRWGWVSLALLFGVSPAAAQESGSEGDGATVAALPPLTAEPAPPAVAPPVAEAAAAPAQPAAPAPSTVIPPPLGWRPTNAVISQTTTTTAPGAATTTAETYTYDGTAPEYIRFHPNRPEPDGYHLESLYRKGLLIPGGIVFGVTYGLSLMVGISQPGEEALAIPIAGPFIRLAQQGAYDEARTALAFAGLAQVASATALGIGLGAKQRWYVRSAPVAVRVVPVVTARRGERAGAYGLSLSGTF